MMPHHRRSVRLKGYDYSQSGAYFVTLVTQGHANLFGEMVKDEMGLSLVGQCAAAMWQALPNHFAITLNAWVVMPNHLHGIILLEDGVRDGRKGDGNRRKGEAFGNKVDCLQDMSSPNASPLPVTPSTPSAKPNGTLSGSLNAIIQNYKSVSTRRINALRNTPGAALWQRNYYEHIIRNDQDMKRIQRYIIDNLAQWSLDEQNLSEGAK